MNRHNLPLARHAATDMSAIGWVMIAYSSNCLISPGWLASIAEGDSTLNATLLYYYFQHRSKSFPLLTFGRGGRWFLYPALLGRTCAGCCCLCKSLPDITG